MSVRWHIFHIRHRTPFYVSLLYQGIAFSRRPDFNFNYHLPLYQINGTVAARMVQWKWRIKATLQRLKKDSNFLKKIMELSYRDYKQALPLWKQIGRLSVKQLSNNELATWLEKYIASAHTLISLALVPLYAEEELTAQIHALVSQRLSEAEAGMAMQVLFTPLKEGAVGEEYHSLLTIATLRPSQVTSALVHHRNRFAWLSNQLYTNTFHSLKYFERRLHVARQKNPRALLIHYQNERRTHAKHLQQWLKRLKPNPAMRGMIESLNEAIYYRSWRTERIYQSGFIIGPFLVAVAKRLNISVRDLLFCLPREVLVWLRIGKRVPPSVIAVRQAGFVYVPTRREKILTGVAMKPWEKQVVDKKVHRKETTLHGQVAFSGTAYGVVCVVRSVQDLAKVKPGAILVTQSTTPLYVPVLHKVKAIVTEEGGVLSHASVISRELKIPCIIGTQIATQVFKDGDKVEVDAEKGIVRKLD